MIAIGKKCAEIWTVLEELRKHPDRPEFETALDFFGRIRALKGVVDLIAKQPGMKDGDPRKAAEQARIAPLKAKMDEIINKVDTTVNLSDPLPYTSPKRVAWKQTQTARLSEIVLDEATAKLIDTVLQDPKLNWATKEMFFDWVGQHLQLAMAEIIKTKKYEGKLLDLVLDTLNSHDKKSVIGACLWAGQTAATSGGNLPGPQTLYVAVVHLRAVRGFRELSSRGAKAVAGDIKDAWFEALRLSATERTAFSDALTDFNAQHEIIGKLPASPTRTQALEAEVAMKKAQQIYDEKLLPVVKSGGQAHAGWALSGGATLLNMLCTFLVWENLDDKKTWKDWADFASSLTNTVAGSITTVSRMFVAIKREITWLSGLAEHPYLGQGVGFVTAIMSIVDGWATIQDAISKTTKDWWMVASGGLQIASGVVIIIAVCLSSPGGQIIGAVIGIVAGAVAVIDDLVTDPMVVFLREMLEKIRGAKSNWDQSSMVKNVGVDTLVDDFDHLIDSTKVTGILYDHDWTSGGSKVGLDRVTDALNDLGVSDGLLRRKLIRIA
jgi:hypothetical protein